MWRGEERSGERAAAELSRRVMRPTLAAMLTGAHVDAILRTRRVAWRRRTAVRGVFRAPSRAIFVRPRSVETSVPVRGGGLLLTCAAAATSDEATGHVRRSPGHGARNARLRAASLCGRRCWAAGDRHHAGWQVRLEPAPRALTCVSPSGLTPPPSSSGHFAPESGAWADGQGTVASFHFPSGISLVRPSFGAAAASGRACAETPHRTLRRTCTWVMSGVTSFAACLPLETSPPWPVIATSTLASSLATAAPRTARAPTPASSTRTAWWPTRSLTQCTLRTR